MSKIDFKLRVFTIDDIDSIVENANNINVAKNLHDRFPFPYTLQDAREFIEIFLPNLEGKVFAIDVEGKAVGTIGLHFQADEYRMNAELGYWLGEKYWNNGIITSAIEKVVVYGFENFDIQKIYAKIYSYNRGSAVVLEKNGFEQEARLINNAFKNGSLTDELVFSKFKNKQRG